MESKLSESRKRANTKWNRKQSIISVRVKPEIRHALDEHLAKTHESLAGFIAKSITEQIKREDGFSQSEIDLDQLLGE
ncbi:MAG: hypothetical protein PUF49_05105 [Firmicutes bacterium]|nr:hypothetical protein [Bacillota bacterium]